MMFRMTEWKREAEIIAGVLQDAPQFDKQFRISKEEFQARRQKVANALEAAGLSCAVVYSDEHYNGDVPYLGGNTNISIEPVAGVIGKNGFFILAGLEGGYIAEQLADRSGCEVHKVEMLKLADEDYPIDAVRVEDVIEKAAGGKPERIGLLTPREVLPVSMFEFLREYAGGEERIVDAQELYYKIKYEKSDAEMKLIKEASQLASVMLEGMLSVLRPGMYETQVAQWGYAIAYELGVEEMGFDIMVTSGVANRTLIGKALNRQIREGDIVHIGVAPKRDGLTACERASVVCVKNPRDITPDQRFWIDFVEEAFKVGLDAYKHVALNKLPAKLQEQALVDYFTSREEEVARRIGRPVNLAKQKPYTGTHNAGYTECQEFYGAITLNSHEPLGEQIVTMLDVAVRGVGNQWNDIVIPGLDYVVVEKTLGKYGDRVEILNQLPINVQHFVGRNFN
ncbi:M24 family metallopeptidase [Paenibacillus sp. GCM10027626]|uniref:M24 family metallopeptidase n=1 Tax=Paenibacillus sp. GCM10027626 TaxID=3273411 RepID=UPI003627100B